MAVKPVVKMLASDFSHLPLLYVWRDSGVCQQHGFDLIVHATKMKSPDQPLLANSDRAPMLLDGTYDFLSGLHHEPYYYRAQGDKRFVYIAQAQNDWDDRFVVGDGQHRQRVWASLLSPKPYPHPLAVWNVYNLDVAHDPNINFIGPFDLWNTEHLLAIDDSDYIDELYGSGRDAVNPAVNPAI